MSKVVHLIVDKKRAAANRRDFCKMLNQPKASPDGKINLEELFDVIYKMKAVRQKSKKPMEIYFPDKESRDRFWLAFSKAKP